MDKYHLSFTSRTTLCVRTVQAPPCHALLISALHYPCWLVTSEVLAHSFAFILSFFFSACVCLGTLRHVWQIFFFISLWIFL